MGAIRPVKLEGLDIYPATVEGLQETFGSPNFILAKARWMSDDEASNCVLCQNKFNQLRRKHHCRMCGRILCSKCCKEKMPLPQLRCEEPERVCEICRPAAECVTKSRSTILSFKFEAVKGIVSMCKEEKGLCKLVELGGVQMLISMSKEPDAALRAMIAEGLHILSTHQPLHQMLAVVGVIKALCWMISACDIVTEEKAVIDSLSALTIFCKLNEFKMKALQDGALDAVLKLFQAQTTPAISLVAVSTLSLLMENPNTHTKIMDNPGNILRNMLLLCGSEDEQMQEISLKTLSHLSMGTDWHRHKIVQEDFTAGQMMLKVMRSKPKNDQILCNATCLVANLSTSSEDQGGLQELLSCLCEIMKSDVKSSALLVQISRGMANFAAFPQNTDKLLQHLPVIVYKFLKSPDNIVKMHGMRAVLHLLSKKPSNTVEELLRDGAGDLLTNISRLPGVIDAIQTSLLTQAPSRSRPSFR
ncbi:unnamed protein product [Mytilus edulis]|uniref:FYVE-type domain-containing protein n=1 Tax=Mytilus edulis TaxID=6550 RepID=A0A8S3SIB8_MYTED|nr:unnamed protein product [Mytilus edulis]